MNTRLFGFIFFISICININAQINDSLSLNKKSQEYPFIIQDSPARLFTMRQTNENYLSINRLYSKVLNNNFKPVLSYAVQTISWLVLFDAFTHEEAHRSILVNKNIGSVSHPFYLSERSGYVDGVTDQTLKNLRDTDFPTFIRLYTAGFESDYMLNWRSQSLLAFEEETYKHICVEYILRKYMLMQYTLIGFIKYDIDGKEEDDELKRDIVGNDFYGAIRHLFRPTMEFKRYTLYSELTESEHNYMRKMGYRTFINLLDPNLYGISNFEIAENIKLNAALGHVMCPFGDFTDEKFWFMYSNNLKLSFYLRQYQNKENWFWAGGCGISDFSICNKFSTTFNIHWWNQPKDLSFVQAKSDFGGAVEFVGKYRFYMTKKSWLNAISLNIGTIYKTKGFLPEEAYMGKHFGVNVGASFIIEE